METPVKIDLESHRIHILGDWSLSQLVSLKSILKKINWPTSGNFILDGSELSYIDSAGAWLINRYLMLAQKQGVVVTLENFSTQHEALLIMVEKETHAENPLQKPIKQTWLESLGESTIAMIDEFSDFLAFVGQLLIVFLRSLPYPKKYRLNALASTVYKTGYQALPIIGLLSFGIGIVLAYQLGVQLRSYGANVFIVNLMGLAVLREFGPLLSAIMIAGRTGSSFTAQLGIMKINQEIDALNTLGVTPAELLIIPRIIGLVIALPLLTIWADIFGIFGGMIMSNNMLHISFSEFLSRFRTEIPLKSLIIGLGKAPVFALLISSIGCFEGMRVEGSAESIGRNTTRSVVLCIFFIIIVDAIFSVILSRWKI